MYLSHKAVRATFRPAGLAESTLVFYMGDNGFCFGGHGLIDRRHMYEESMRVPFLAQCPEVINPGSKITRLVQNIDVAPTILEAAGRRSEVVVTVAKDSV